MTSQSPENPDPEEVSAAGMPESSIGKILQRGGEELLLEKVDDRFTVQTTDPQAIADLAEQLPVEAQAERGPNQLTEIVVEAGQRDAAMRQMRQSGQVDYASHVYQIQDNPNSLVYLTDQMTIQFSAQTSESEIQAIAAEVGLQLLKPVTGIPNTFVFQVTAAATENPVKITNRLMGRSQVLTAEPNIVVRTESFYRPRDPVYRQQWHLHHNGGRELATGSHISAERAWDITRGVRSVIVAIMDDSVDLDHPDFQGAGKIVAPRDFGDDDMLPMPELTDDNHGTACAGVSVAEENGTGSVGVAPGCALMPIRTSGYLDDQTIEDLFGWAIAKGASVISCSWGPAAVYFPLSLRQRAALTRAATTGRDGKGCVIVFAAGNSNRPTRGTVNESNWPNNALTGATNWLNGFAAHPDVMIVSACTSLNRKSAYSCWGKEISVCAPSNNAPPGVGLPQLGYVFTPPEVREFLPGLGVVTSDRTGSEGYDQGDFTASFGGTSSACPVVAGVAALVLSANPDLTAAEVKQILQQTADKITDPNPDPQFGLQKGTYAANGHSEWFGYGKVNAFKAVQAAQQQRQAATIRSTRQIRQENTTSMAIPDNNPQGISSRIQVRETSVVRDIQVGVAIRHEFMGDLEMRLIPPSGQAILLHGRTLGRTKEWRVIYSVQTTLLLSQVIGRSPQGTWTLQVVDHALADTGTLERWELILGV